MDFPYPSISSNWVTSSYSSFVGFIYTFWNSVNILDTFWEENLKASALRLLDPFYDQFSVLYRGLVIQFLLNSSFIIKYDVIFDNICYTISSYVSSLMEREGFRLENRVKPFDTAIICYFASFLRILTLLFPAIKGGAFDAETF